jgi:3-hydroxy-9,10-secoandrosta-1,3,5(10)-triene-9,17-dione monooxygenase reductase component
MIDFDELLSNFQAGEIAAADFPHERHVQVTWALAQRYPREEALRRLIDGIRGIAARAGRPRAYHETITRAWFELISGANDLRRYPELFDKGLLGRYYTPARLAEGRQRWLEPDLHPLRLPAPEPAAARSQLPDVLRRIPTAVAIFATHNDRTVHATTVSSMTSVSSDPALVSVCLANGSRTLDLLGHARTFALSVLASNQSELAVRFAKPDRPADGGQFTMVAHHLSPFGPLIESAAAWVGCDVHGAHRCGDHTIVVGAVGLAEATHRHPLVRHGGVYH